MRNKHQKADCQHNCKHEAAQDMQSIPQPAKI